MEKHKKKFNGFTLAELAVVMAIIGIIAAISIKISKSKSIYESQFMTYSAYTNLKHAVGEIVADGWQDAADVSQTGIPDIWDNATAPRFGLCQRFAVSSTEGCPACGVFNVVGTPDCTTSTTTTFTDANLAFTTTNGQRYFYSGTASPDYIIYIDINGTKGNSTLNEDVIGFTVSAGSSGGVVLPIYNTPPATNTNYLSASVRYRNASGNMIMVDQGVSLQTATCDAFGTYGSTPCSTTNYTTYCQTNLCEVIINKPGY